MDVRITFLLVCSFSILACANILRRADGLRLHTSNNGNVLQRPKLSHTDRTKRIVRSVVDSRQNCGKWTTWIDDNTPNNLNKNDKESMAPDKLETFCPNIIGGSVSKVECKDNNGEPFSGNKTSPSHDFFVSCYDVKIGVICSVSNNSTDMCPNMAIRYFCNCTPIFQGTIRTSVLPGASFFTTASGLGTMSSGYTPSKAAVMTAERASVTNSGIKTTCTTTAVIETTSSIPGQEKNAVGQNEVVMSVQIGSMSIRWWILVLVVSGTLFLINIGVSICLYKRSRAKVKQCNTIDPL